MDSTPTITPAATPTTHLPREERELIPSDSPLAPYVSVNPGRMHGEPCFRDTRVPIQTLFDHLEIDGGLQQFLAGFPNVPRDSAVAVIGLASRGLSLVVASNDRCGPPFCDRVRE